MDPGVEPLHTKLMKVGPEKARNTWKIIKTWKTWTIIKKTRKTKSLQNHEPSMKNMNNWKKDTKNKKNLQNNEQSVKNMNNHESGRACMTMVFCEHWSTWSTLINLINPATTWSTLRKLDHPCVNLINPAKTWSSLRQLEQSCENLINPAKTWSTLIKKHENWIPEPQGSYDLLRPPTHGTHEHGWKSCESPVKVLWESKGWGSFGVALWKSKGWRSLGVALERTCKNTRDGVISG